MEDFLHLFTPSRAPALLLGVNVAFFRDLRIASALVLEEGHELRGRIAHGFDALGEQLLARLRLAYDLGHLQGEALHSLPRCLCRHEYSHPVGIAIAAKASQLR